MPSSRETCRPGTIFLPYFPIVPAFLWLGGLLERLTTPSTAQYAVRASLLYAASPVAILLSAIHGQWDDMALLLAFASFYVRDHYVFTRRTGFVMGVSFTLSILVKPIAVILATFLLPVLRGDPIRALRDHRYVAGFV